MTIVFRVLTWILALIAMGWVAWGALRIFVLPYDPKSNALSFGAIAVGIFIAILARLAQAASHRARKERVPPTQ